MISWTFKTFKSICTLLNIKQTNLSLLMESTQDYLLVRNTTFSNQYFKSIMLLNRCSILVNRFGKYLFQSSQLVVCNHIAVDSCTREFVWMKQFLPATTRSTTLQMTVNQHIWAVLFNYMTVDSSMCEYVWWDISPSGNMSKTMSIAINQHFWVFVSIYDFLSSMR